MRVLEAKKILPKDEFEIFEAVLMNQISRMSQPRLQQKATLARRLRDKYRDQARRDVVELRSRRTNEVDTDINDRRVQLFKEVIERLEEALSETHHEPSHPQHKAKAKSALGRSNGDLSKDDRRQIQEARHR